MSRKYEIVYILDSALEEAEATQVLDRLHETLKSDTTPTPITSAAHWGRRTLAYPIKRKPVGYYVLVKCEAPPAALAELERLIKLEERVLRHLIVLDENFSPFKSPSSDGDDDSSDSEGP